MMETVPDFFFLRRRRPPRSPLVPHTALFRSAPACRRSFRAVAGVERGTPPDLHQPPSRARLGAATGARRTADRKSTRLNSSHANISYAVFCLKTKTLRFTSRTMHALY